MDAVIVESGAAQCLVLLGGLMLAASAAIAA